MIWSCSKCVLVTVMGHDSMTHPSIPGGWHSKCQKASRGPRVHNFWPPGAGARPPVWGATAAPTHWLLPNTATAISGSNNFHSCFSPSKMLNGNRHNVRSTLSKKLPVVQGHHQLFIVNLSVVHQYGFLGILCVVPCKQLSLISFCPIHVG